MSMPPPPTPHTLSETMLRACTMHACIVLCTCSTYNFIGRIRVHVFNCVILINIMTVMHENSETIKVGEMLNNDLFIPSYKSHLSHVDTHGIF